MHCVQKMPITLHTVLSDCCAQHDLHTQNSASFPIGFERNDMADSHPVNHTRLVTQDCNN